MNPLTVMASSGRCHSISYDYDTKTGRIDVRRNVTLPYESYVHAFQVIDASESPLRATYAATTAAGANASWYENLL
jgi:hypothetical protein